jgi:hypothetical protein
MDARSSIANDLFYKVRSRFTGLKLGTETGTITINPEEARFFDFDYKDGEVPVGHVTISLAEPNSMKVYFSSGITESMEQSQKKNWYGFLRELRSFAKRRLMAFDTRDIAKDNLDTRDFEFLTTINKPTAAKDTIVKPVGESIMNESQLYGTKTVSYQKLMDTRLIIKHSHALTDDQQPGARSRNISALFVENQDGERFKYPFIHLAGARAMQRHVANGGLPYDDLGKSIIRMSEEIAQLKSFGNYVVRNDLMNSDNNGIVERATSALNNLREQMVRLSKQGYYESYKESFQAQQDLEVPEDVIEDYTDKFTVRNFKEDIKSVFPIIYRLMQEDSKVDYDDIVAMTTTEQTLNDEAELDLEEDQDELADFENWVSGLGESSPIQSTEEQLVAIDSLNKLVGNVFPAGVDGTNAIESLKGIIEDPKLFKEIKDAARQNPQEDVRPMIQTWLEQNAEEILGKIEFGDMEQAADVGAEEPAEPEGEEGIPGVDAEAPAEEEPVMQSDDNMDRGESRSLNVKELAEFIHSFYDRDSGTFPKGPEGVCTMVGKKFGEQAEQVARKFVERMAPQQSTRNNPELQELARIRELSGLKNEASDDSEGPADLLAAVEEEINNPGRHTDNLRDVLNATFDADDSPAFEKARAVIEKYLDLVDNADVGSEEDGIEPMRGGDIARHIRDYDLTDRLQHAAAMLDKIGGMGETMTQEGSGNYMWQEVGDDADKKQLQSMAERLVKLYKHYGETSASDEEIMSVLDDVVREFVPQVGKMTNVAPVSQAFFDKLPIKSVEPEYDDDGEEIEPEDNPRERMHDAIWPMVKITAAAEKGDTSNYGYKVHPKKEETDPELESIKRLVGLQSQQTTASDNVVETANGSDNGELQDIRRLSGIAKGLGF